MKPVLFLSVTIFFLLGGCGIKKENSKHSAAEGHPAVMSEIEEKNLTPTVDIEKYVLVGPPGDERHKDATEIADLKRKWPLAMQSQNVAAFDSILSADFVFTGDGQVLNRQDYIEDRTAPSEWKIIHVKYDNLVLQFFGDMALLTYRNRVTNENTSTKAVEIEYISWADIYRKEKGKWKINAAHVVDFRMEKH